MGEPIQSMPASWQVEQAAVTDECTMAGAAVPETLPIMKLVKTVLPWQALQSAVPIGTCDSAELAGDVGGRTTVVFGLVPTSVLPLP